MPDIVCYEMVYYTKDIESQFAVLFLFIFLKIFGIT